MKNVYMLAVLSLILWSCGGGYNPEAEKNKILDVHDEVMPKIGEVMNLKKKVLDKAGILSEEEASLVQELRALAQELDDANSGMMSWMRDWSKNSNEYLNMKAGEEAQVDYLTNQMEKVTEVKEAINSAIQRAKEALM
ncbi:MAG TPA: hypothetical protein VIN11_00370 [Roseivirga sp.]